MIDLRVPRQEKPDSGPHAQAAHLEVVWVPSLREHFHHRVLGVLVD